jgi:hypothetical protein
MGRGAPDECKNCTRAVRVVGGQAQPDRLFQKSLRTKKTAGHAGGWGNVLP